MVPDLDTLFFVAAEDHLARRGLKHAGHRRLDGLADHLPRIVHDDHGSVVEIGNALVEFLAFFQDEHLHGLARQIHRLQRIRELIDIEHLDAAKLSDLVQVEIVRHDLRVQFLRQLDELHIHFANRGVIVLHELHGNARHFLNPLENIESATAAIALQRVGRIRDLLELTQNEVRNDENAVQKSGFADIGDPPVDDDTRVENLVRLLRRMFATEDAAERRQVQQIAFVRANHESDIGHQEQDEELDERERIGVEDRVGEHVADQRSSHDSHNRTDCRADETFQSCPFQPVFEVDDADCTDKAESNRVGTFETERLNEISDQR